MKKIVTFSFVLISFQVFSQPVITALYNPVYGDTYVYKIVDDTATAQPGQAGAGVIWNLTSMHGQLNTRQYNWMQTALTNDAGIYGANSNMAAEIIENGFGTRYEYFNVGAAFTGDMKKVGSHVDLAITNFYGGYLVWDYPMSYLQSCTDTMNGFNGVAYINGRSTTTYDGHGTLQLEAQSGGSFSNVARIKVEENFIMNYGIIEPHTIKTYYWMDHSTINLTKQPIAIIMTHEWTDINGLFKREKFAVMRQILFPGGNSVPETILSSSNVSVSPNPFQNKISFSLPGINSDIDIQICDITGRVLKNLHLEKSYMPRQETIDLKELRSGIYLAKIASGKGTVVKRIFKD